MIFLFFFQNFAQCEGRPVSWLTITTSVALHSSTSCFNFAPAAFSPFKEIAWLKRFSDGNFEADGNFPFGKKFLKSSFNNGTSKITLVMFNHVVLGANMSTGLHMVSRKASLVWEIWIKTNIPSKVHHVY